MLNVPFLKESLILYFIVLLQAKHTAVDAPSVQLAYKEIPNVADEQQ